MSWGPVQPAGLDLGDAGAAAESSTRGAPAAAHAARSRAQQIFLGGNQLPGRWARQSRFVVLETGFGLGHNFLATWAAWQQDSLRCERLVYLGIDPHPPLQANLARAHAGSPFSALADLLARQWPLPTPDLHCLDFDGGRVRLLLALGDVSQVLPELVAQVDAFYLDGFAAPRDPGQSDADRWDAGRGDTRRWDARRLRGLHRLAAPGATLAAGPLAGSVRDGLQAAGFALRQVAGPPPDREMTVARFAPRVLAAAPPGRQPLRLAPAQRAQVAVIGAGLAGAAVARALAAQGLAVQVFDRQPAAAGETSGNAGGLFHGIVHGHDGPHARWLRAAALHTERLLRPLIEAGAVPGTIAGLLRGEQALSPTEMAALLQRQGLPAGYAQVRPGALPGGRSAWYYPGGGWVAPADLCRHWLAGAGIEARFNRAVHRLQAAGPRWRLLDAADQCLAEVDAVVLCNAADALRLAGGAVWPTQLLRGQTTLLPAGLAGLAGLPGLALPLADGGYALRLGDGGVLCGGSSQADDDHPQPRAADHAVHLATLRRLTGWAGVVDLAQLQGRVGWRLQADDRLPLLGGVPDEAAPASSRRLDQPRWVPRRPGLYVFTALGSRGITQAALGGEILAAVLTGAPVPAPASLLDAVDPARFIARAVRASSR